MKAFGVRFPFGDFIVAAENWKEAATQVFDYVDSSDEERTRLLADGVEVKELTNVEVGKDLRPGSPPMRVKFRPKPKTEKDEVVPNPELGFRKLKLGDPQ